MRETERKGSGKGSRKREESLKGGRRERLNGGRETGWKKREKGTDLKGGREFW